MTVKSHQRKSSSIVREDRSLLFQCLGPARLSPFRHAFQLLPLPGLSKKSYVRKSYCKTVLIWSNADQQSHA